MPASIFLLIFNAIFFAIGGIEHKLSVWLPYGLMHFAYLMLLFTQYLIHNSKNITVLGGSFDSVSSAYFWVSFFTGIILITPDINNVTAWIIQICVAGVYSILLISYMIAREYRAGIEEKRQYQITTSKVKENSRNS